MGSEELPRTCGSFCSLKGPGKEQVAEGQSPIISRVGWRREREPQAASQPAAGKWARTLPQGRAVTVCWALKAHLLISAS